MAKILILANNDVGLYKFRKELIQKLVEKYEVFISLPYGEFVPQLKELGCKFIETPISRRGTNPITDLKLLLKYKVVVKNIKPDVVVTYTIKPNVYGGFVCRVYSVPYIATITGLGTSIENAGLIKKVAMSLYKVGLKRASCVFFQNKPNRELFLANGIVAGRNRCIPGSGVNLEQHCLEEYPDAENGLKFLFIGRIMREKGIGELFDVAPQIKVKYPNVQFDLVGEIEEDYAKQIKELEKRGIIRFHGQQSDVHSFIKKCHAIILPSYHEGIANVLLETASSGRPILASRVTGCIETFDEGVSGLGFEVRSVPSLFETVIRFINLPHQQKKDMGITGRKKMEEEFDRSVVINAYMEEIDAIIKSSKEHARNK